MAPYTRTSMWRWRGRAGTYRSLRQGEPVPTGVEGKVSQASESVARPFWQGGAAALLLLPVGPLLQHPVPSGGGPDARPSDVVGPGVRRRADLAVGGRRSPQCLPGSLSGIPRDVAASVSGLPLLAFGLPQGSEPWQLGAEEDCLLTQTRVSGSLTEPQGTVPSRWAHPPELVTGGRDGPVPTAGAAAPATRGRSVSRSLATGS